MVRWKAEGRPDHLGLIPKSFRNVRWLMEHKDWQGDECLIWPGALNGNGRGTAHIGRGPMSAPRAMCILAHGEPPTPEHHAAHTCGNGHIGCANPRYLRWATPAENEQDKVLHGTLRKGTAINTAKLNEHAVRDIRRRLADGETGKAIAAEFGVTPALVSNIKLRKSWAWLD